MRVLSSILVLLVLLLSGTVVAPAKVLVEEVAKSLPREVDGFRLSGAVTSLSGQEIAASNEHAALGALFQRSANSQGFALVGSEYVSALGET